MFSELFDGIHVFSTILQQNLYFFCDHFAIFWRNLHFFPILWWNIHFFRRLWQNLHFFQWSLMMKFVEFFYHYLLQKFIFFLKSFDKIYIFFQDPLRKFVFFFFKRSFDTIYVFSRFLHKIYDSLMKLVIFSANIWSIFFFVTICGNLWYFYVWTFQKKEAFFLPIIQKFNPYSFV